ncbi:YcxB family protein [Methylocella sp. CPCC 101449]|uniref:YcxB family protein n=1 Tax=Methylocella sp. CPCC 101449 TaxID=2987531 RepID=UPI00288E2CA1|nr:YcxB family protein [Methylocella sp. CPCC 101449]MDT2024323.1 YcxB family protein [Methylocella sp. CPCC 101449]
MMDSSQISSVSYRARYTPEIVRDAVKTYVRRRLFAEQKGLWIAAGAMAVLFIGLLWSGQRDWLTGIVGAAAVLPALLLIAGWRAHSANTVGRFSRMKEPVAEIAYDATTLSFTSDLGSAQVPWSQLTEVWQRPGYWMIFFDKNQFNVLPDDDMPDGLRQKLRDNV